MRKPKVIVSHDVDHLFPKEHYFRYLIYPKLWVKSILKLLHHDIGLTSFAKRMASPFEERRHRIPEIIEFDREYGVPSTFFFGVSQGLGMSYFTDECVETVRYVQDNGFDVGVHGIAFDDAGTIAEEHERFLALTGLNDFGIRTHYVRMAEESLALFEKAGYRFDTSIFDRQRINFKKPFRVGAMWEFPLHIMDGYIVFDGKLESAKQVTLEAIREAEQICVPYITLLFHDYQFDDSLFPDQCAWYKWAIRYFNDNEYGFISYQDAIKELEEGI